MLLPSVIVAVVLFTSAMVTVIAFGRVREHGLLKHVIVVVGSTIDGIITVFLLSLFSSSTTVLLFGGIMFGLLSLIGFQILLFPQRRFVWTLAYENMRRRKRQSVLMVTGLIITSAILSSSFIIGDSLDATITGEVEATWTETDLLISGFNPNTGVSVEFSEKLAERMWQQITDSSQYSSMVDGRQHGITSTISAISPSGLGLSNIQLYANNASLDDEGVWPTIGSDAQDLSFSTIELLNRFEEQTPSVIVNKKLAVEMDASVGDTLKLTIFRDASDGDGRERIYRNATIYAIADMEGYALRGGTSSASLFVDLPTAQSWLSMEGSLTRIEYSFTSDAHIQSIADALQDELDSSVNADDIGLIVADDDQSGGLSISSQSDFGLINATVVQSLRNITVDMNEVQMLESLFAPLISVEFDDEELLSLSSSKINGLEYQERTLWHWTNKGFGYHTDDEEPWLFRHSDQHQVNDFALHSNNTAVAGSSNGLQLVQAGNPEDESTTLLSNHDVHAVISSDDTFFSASTSDGEFYFHYFDQRGVMLHNSTFSDIDISTTIEYSFSKGEHVYLQQETFFDVNWYKIQVEPFVTLIEIQAHEVELLTEEDEQDDGVVVHELCDEQLVVERLPHEAWCTTDFGLLRWNMNNSTIQSIRLPVLSEIDGIGSVPQLLVGFGQGNGSISDSSILQSRELIHLISDQKGLDQLSLRGVLPYAFGNLTPVTFNLTQPMNDVFGYDNLSSLESVFFGVGSIDEVQTLSLAQDDERSLLFLSSPNRTMSFDERATIVELLNSTSTLEGMYISVQPIQADAIEQAKTSSALLSGMFVVFGSFTIAAGVLLTITIMLLLFEVRKSEVATVRALGLRQSDARSLFFYEGAVLATLGGSVGTLLGGILAWVVGEGFSNIFESVGATGFQYAWTIDSVLLGWFCGTLVSFTVLWVMGWWNSRLNIVQVLRDLRIHLHHSIPWFLFVVQFFSLASTIMLIVILVLTGLDSSFASLLVLSIGLLTLSALIPLIFWQIPIWFKSYSFCFRLSRYAPRNTVGALGLTYLVWLQCYKFFIKFDNIEETELTLIVSGIMQVMAGVLVLSSLAPVVISKSLRYLPFSPRKHLITNVALAHPLAHPVRTAAVIGMFSLTMFSVIVLSGYTAQFDVFTTQFVEEAEGEYEILLTSSRSRPLDFPSDLDDWNLSDTEHIDSVSRIYRAPVHLEDEQKQRMPYILRGFDDNFSQHGGLPLHIWDESLGATEKEAWISIGNRDDIVFVDASFGLELATDGAGLNPLQFSIGDLIYLIDFSYPENRRIVQVGGFLAQSSYLYSPGIWVSDEVVKTQFDGSITRMYISVSDSDTDETMIQGKPASARMHAEDLADELNQNYAHEGVQVTLIQEDIKTLQSLINALLKLFEGYLSIGLFVGIMGIGVVTFRNVSERTPSIGMLRSYGLRRNEVGLLFAIEVTWVAVLGLLNGFIVAFMFHYSLHAQMWSEQGVAFTFPFFDSLLILVMSLLAVLGATCVPLYKSTRVSPATAQRI